MSVAQWRAASRAVACAGGACHGAFGASVQAESVPVEEKARKAAETKAETTVKFGGGEGSKGGEEDEGQEEDVEEEVMDSTRERAILKLNSQIQLDAFDNHYDSTIVEGFHWMQQAVRGALRDTIVKPKKSKKTAEMTEVEEEDEEDEEERTRREQKRPETTTAKEGRGDGGEGVVPSLEVLLATSAQRLARREDERKRQERVFHVFRGYDIHKRPEHGSGERST